MLSAILSPSNSQSWTSWKRDVYRPRLALFLLALLLASTPPLHQGANKAGIANKNLVSEVQVTSPPQAKDKVDAQARSAQHQSGQPKPGQAASPLLGLSYSDLIFRPDKVIRRTSQHLFTNDGSQGPSAAERSSATHVADVAAPPAPSYQTISQPSPAAARPTGSGSPKAKSKGQGKQPPAPPRPMPAQASQQNRKQLQDTSAQQADGASRQRKSNVAHSSALHSGSGSQPHTISRPAQRADAPYNGSRREKASTAIFNGTLSIEDVKASLRAHRDDILGTVQAALEAAGLGALSHPHVLPFLILMHVILAIRLLGMLLDDAINQELFSLVQQTGQSTTSLPRTRQVRRTLSLALFYIAVLLFSAVAVSLPSVLDGLKDGILFLLSLQTSFLEVSPTPKRKVSGLFPARTVLALELLATISSLTLPLYRLTPLLSSENRDGAARWSFGATIPKSITLPSPSHSPPLSEILHLPEWFCAIFDPRIRAEARVRALNRGPGRQAGSGTPNAQASDRVSDDPVARTTVMALRAEMAAEQDATLGVAQRRLRRHPLGLPEPPADFVAPTLDPPPVSAQTGPGLQNPLTLAMVAGQGPASAPSASASSSESVRTPPAPTASASTPAESTSAVSSPSTTTPAVSGKSLRLSHQHVRVQLGWFLESFVAFFDRLAGVLMYAVVVLSLPTLTPTSIYPLVALVALRNEAGHLVMCWTKARQTVECLEFVRRRWGVGSALRSRVQSFMQQQQSASPGKDGAGRVYQAVWSGEEQTCCMCFEPTPAFPSRRSSSASQDAGHLPDSSIMDEEAEENTCVLDCAHVLHADCLVTWLRAQNFCPVCHAPLNGTPPGWKPSGLASPGLAAGGGMGDGGVPVVPAS